MLKGRISIVLSLIVVSMIGAGVFHLVLAAFDRPRSTAEAERRLADLSKRYDQRIESVARFAEQLGKAQVINEAQFLAPAFAFVDDPAFLCAEWQPRIEPEGRPDFNKELRKRMAGVSIRLTERDNELNHSITDDEVVFPIRFTTRVERESTDLGVYRKYLSAVKDANEKPHQVIVARDIDVVNDRSKTAATLRAVPAYGKGIHEKHRGFVAVHFEDLFAPFAPESYKRTDYIVHPVEPTGFPSVVAGSAGVDLIGKPLLNRIVRNDAADYRVEVYESKGVAVRRASLSLLGLFLGPVFVCSLLRLQWQRAATQLASKNSLLSDEVSEHREIQRTLQSLLALRDQERRLFANDIHDGFIQEATSAQMFLEALSVRIDEQDALAQEHLHNAQQMIELAISEGRQFVNEQKPLAVDQYGFFPALQRLLTEQRERFGLSVAVRYPPEMPAIDVLLQRSIYRIIQESLSNIRRHSGATEASISLHLDGDWVTVEIVDQGCGFELQDVGEHSFGLRSIRERAEEHGGDAVIKSVLGEGTFLTVRFPLGTPTDVPRTWPRSP